jgi:Fe2+ or Zn2+ uptake regulation protein
MAATTRYSRQREAILKLLESTDEHPTAETIYERIRLTIPNISLGTVYRNLAFLADSGRIIKIRMRDDTLRFDARIHTHYHVQCRLSGKVDDLAMDVDPQLSDEAERLPGAMIEFHDLCFIGVCRECRGKSNSQ